MGVLACLLKSESGWQQFFDELFYNNFGNNGDGEQ